MKNLFFIFSILVFVLMTDVANAYDFYGASITVREVSMSMWRMGIAGNYPVVDNIALNSPAAKAGLSQGNIILSINDKIIKTVSDLDISTTNVLSVKILNNYDRKTIVIDRAAIEAEKAKRNEEENKSVVKISPPTKTEEHSDATPLLMFDDTALEKKFGISNKEQSWVDEALRKANKAKKELEKDPWHDLTVLIGFPDDNNPSKRISKEFGPLTLIGHDIGGRVFMYDNSVKKSKEKNRKVFLIEVIYLKYKPDYSGKNFWSGKIRYLCDDDPVYRDNGYFQGIETGDKLYYMLCK